MKIIGLKLIIGPVSLKRNPIQIYRHDLQKITQFVVSHINFIKIKFQTFNWPA